MAEQNIIPAIGAAGRFEAIAPFSTVVNPNTFYTVEATRTIPEMQGLKIKIYERVFKPIGLSEADYPTVLEKAISENAVVVSLIPRSGPPVYVLTTYLKSFPLVDGYSYERMCIVTDCGALPPEMKDNLVLAMQHFDTYIKAHFGVEGKSTLGTVPVIGYVSKNEHDVFETTRKNTITDDSNDLSRIRDLEAALVARDEYIKDLESRLGVP